MAKTLEPVAELKRIVKECGTQRAAASLLGISQALLSDLLFGRRGFSDNMLEKMGLEKRETFTRVAR